MWKFDRFVLFTHPLLSSYFNKIVEWGWNRNRMNDRDAIRRTTLRSNFALIRSSGPEHQKLHNEILRIWKAFQINENCHRPRKIHPYQNLHHNHDTIVSYFQARIFYTCSRNPFAFWFVYCVYHKTNNRYGECVLYSKLLNEIWI